MEKEDELQNGDRALLADYSNHETYPEVSGVEWFVKRRRRVCSHRKDTVSWSHNGGWAPLVEKHETYTELSGVLAFQQGSE